MIRINLLAPERERTRRLATLQTGQKLTIACGLILIVAGLGVGWWYWTLGKRAAALDREIAASRQETLRLREVIQQVQQFDRRKIQLQQRVGLIEQLAEGRTGAVRMLDQISRNLPDGLWLTELRQQGAEVTINGRCTTLTALSDLVGNLSASGYFQSGVEILDSAVEPAAPPVGEVIRFSVRAQFSPPGG